MEASVKLTLKAKQLKFWHLIEISTADKNLKILK